MQHLYLTLSRYNGRRTGPPQVFSPLLEEALQHVEKEVRREMATRTRLPLEWAGGEWSANVCAANCYRGSKEGVGAHSDQLTCESSELNPPSNCAHVNPLGVRPRPISNYSIDIIGYKRCHHNVRKRPFCQLMLTLPQEPHVSSDYVK